MLLKRNNYVQINQICKMVGQWTKDLDYEPPHLILTIYQIYKRRLEVIDVTENSQIAAAVQVVSIFEIVNLFIREALKK